MTSRQAAAAVRPAVLAVFLLAGCLTIVLLTLVLDRDGRAAQLLLDRRTTIFRYPFTIQNIEHLAFFVGLGDLLVRWLSTRRELAYLRRGFLPEDEETILQPADLGDVRDRVAGHYSDRHGFLPFLADASILQFQVNRSVDQAVAVLNANIELLAHRVDLSYQFTRYLTWFIPTIGFFGTVVGIGSTLGLVPQSGQPNLYEMAQNLTVAFDTTIVALAESAVLVFLLNMVQAREEHAVNAAGTYTLRHLVSRLYNPA